MFAFGVMPFGLCSAPATFRFPMDEFRVEERRVASAQAGLEKTG